MPGVLGTTLGEGNKAAAVYSQVDQKNKTVSSGGGFKFYKSYCETNEGQKEAANGIYEV